MISKAIASPSGQQTETTFYEIDSAILDRLEEYFDDDKITSIEARAFTRTLEYQKLREFLKSLNAQMFFTYLFQSKIEKLTPPQIQAILDEINERAI